MRGGMYCAFEISFEGKIKFSVCLFSVNDRLSFFVYYMKNYSGKEAWRFGKRKER